jgi:hypothetical protein
MQPLETLWVEISRFLEPIASWVPTGPYHKVYLYGSVHDNYVANIFFTFIFLFLLQVES